MPRAKAKSVRKRTPWRIVRRDGYRFTSDGRFQIRLRFNLMWAAFRDCTCKTPCFCEPARLPAGAAGTGFHTLKAIQAALKKRYRSKGGMP